MDPPILYDTSYPHVHLSLCYIRSEAVPFIKEWFTYLKTSLPDARFQLDLDASHDQFPEIVSTILPYLEEDANVAYVHITQTKKVHYLTPHMCHEIVMARNKKNRFTIQVNVDGRADYF